MLICYLHVLFSEMVHHGFFLPIFKLDCLYFTVIFESSLCILDMRNFSDTGFANVFLPSVADKGNFISFYLLCIVVLVSKNCSPNSRSQRFSLKVL